MALQDHLFSSMSSFYGLASDKNQLSLEQVPSSNLKQNSSVTNHSVILTERKIDKVDKGS